MQKQIFTLFMTFLKIGACTFGGGYAMIPLIQHDIVNIHHWMNQEELLDIVAVAESTPGPIAINSATFTGYKVAGFKGALAATCGVATPSFLIILFLSSILAQFESVPIVRWAFSGIAAAVLALVINALWAMYKACPKNIFALLIMLLCFVGVSFFKVSAIFMLVVSALTGFVYLCRKDKKAQ